jgi:PAS domain S-box-containing protein
MDIDIRTLAIVLAIVADIQAIAFFFQYLINKTYRGVGWWVLGSSLAAFGYVLLLLQDTNPIISIILANTLLISGAVSFYIGITRFLDQRENRWIICAILAVFLIAFFYFTYGNDLITIRTIIFSVTLAIISFLTALSLLGNKIRSITTSAQLIAAVFFAYGSFFIFRTMAAITIAPVDTVFTPSLVQTATFLASLIEGLLITVGLIIMVNQRLNAEMSEAKEEFELIFNTSPDAALIIRFDDGIIVNINDGFSAITGFNRYDTIGRSLFDLKIWVDPASCQKIVDGLRKKGFCENFEAEFLRKDKSKFPGLLSAKVIMLQNIPHIISITRDMTERKRADEALQQANTKLSMLNNITRHDILNQLMGLRTYLELSKEDVTDPVYLGYIQKEEEAAETIEWQIEFARDYQDIGTTAPKWQLIADIIGSATKQLKPSDSEINVAVTGVEIFADPLVERVFYTLMENSLRHGVHVTRMDYSVRETNDDLIIIYCDDGVGITREDKKKLFLKGFGKHTGLGLFLSKEILSITSITISENGEPGKGVQFEIVVPKGMWRKTGTGE